MGITMTEKVITRAEASRRSGLNLSTIDRLVRSGELKRVKLPGGARASILESSLDRVLEKLRVEMAAG